MSTLTFQKSILLKYIKMFKVLLSTSQGLSRKYYKISSNCEKLVFYIEHTLYFRVTVPYNEQDTVTIT